VNLAILVPLVSLHCWRCRRPALASRPLAIDTAFGIAFGFVEAVVVVYPRAVIGLYPAGDPARNLALALLVVPRELLWIEVLREAATIVMLVSVALLAAQRAREHRAMFLFIFAVWDLAYYAGLPATIGWPPSVMTDDVLFLIPVPWISDLWFPVLVSVLNALALLFASARSRSSIRGGAAA